MKNKILFFVFLAACLEPAITFQENSKDIKTHYVCSPTNCTGCCRNNICRGGNDNDACGYDGRLCVECVDSVCEIPGTCIGYGKLPIYPTPDSGCFVVERKLLCW
jgi:hypothetical protein